VRPKITYRNTDTAYKSDTKFFVIYITENLKWTTHICLLRLQLSKCVTLLNEFKELWGWV
jgi:hypothetical protein